MYFCSVFEFNYLKSLQNLEIIVPAIYFTAIFLQLIYILFIFTKLAGHQDFSSDTEGQKFPGVSVVIAAFNELHNLKELLPLLEQQDYPDFEIVIADDRSEDGTYDYLLTNEGHFSKVTFVRIKDLPGHFTAKKYAVTMGIKKASKDILLLTDADCRPAGDQWIRQMAAQLTDDKDIVTGFSPYTRVPGRLNALIRYETFQTALQYMSFALARMPYMGVGRNLMYRKKLFWSTNGFAKHIGLLSGDDDLFINEASRSNNVAVCTDESAHIESMPKLTWGEWYTQKRRHLSVGKKYRFRDKLNLGLLWFGQIISWLGAIPLLFMNPEWFEAPEWSRIPADWLKQYGLAHWYPFNDWMRLVVGVFLGWLLIKWIVLSLVNKKLNHTISSWKIPYYDFLYALYLFLFGIITVFSDPKKIKWR